MERKQTETRIHHFRSLIVFLILIVIVYDLHTYTVSTQRCSKRIRPAPAFQSLSIGNGLVRIDFLRWVYQVRRIIRRVGKHARKNVNHILCGSLCLEFIFSCSFAVSFTFCVLGPLGHKNHFWNDCDVFHRQIFFVSSTGGILFAAIFCVLPKM